MIRKSAVAVAAGLAIAGSAIAAPSAFAAQPPQSTGLTITASVPVSESITLSQSAGSLAITAGSTTPVYAFDTTYGDPGQLVVTFATNDAAGWTGTVAEPTPLTAGHYTIPETETYTPVFTGAVAGNPVNGSATPVDTPFSNGTITLANETGPTGMLSGSGNFQSNGTGGDELTSNVSVNNTSSNQPGGTYTGSFTYSIIGS